VHKPHSEGVSGNPVLLFYFSPKKTAIVNSINKPKYPQGTVIQDRVGHVLQLSLLAAAFTSSRLSKGA